MILRLKSRLRMHVSEMWLQTSLPHYPLGRASAPSASPVQTRFFGVAVLDQGPSNTNVLEPHLLQDGLVHLAVHLLHLEHVLDPWIVPPCAVVLLDAVHLSELALVIHSDALGLSQMSLPTRI